MRRRRRFLFLMISRPSLGRFYEDHLMIDTEEAGKLYDRIAADDFPTLEELKNDPVVNHIAVP